MNSSIVCLLMTIALAIATVSTFVKQNIDFKNREKKELIEKWVGKCTVEYSYLTLVGNRKQFISANDKFDSLKQAENHIQTIKELVNDDKLMLTCREITLKYYREDCIQVTSIYQNPYNERNEWAWEMNIWDIDIGKYRENFKGI